MTLDGFWTVLHVGLGSVWDLLVAVFGEATWNEVALVAVFFLCIVIYARLPRLGEAVGAWFDRRRR